ncbi:MULTISPECIES: MBOAT family O-acyltransferase [unclassified Moraxella]|uniref:MBOAT family O-acyltransferase n=1 Tax=unclassified Moraxella TaxID=2685852 RepID=UPI003AF82DB8
MNYLCLYFFSVVLFLFFSSRIFDSIVGVCTALVASFCILFILKLIKHSWVSYGLFFTISLTSFVGITQTLTGSHAGSTLPFLFGLSFYTTTFAYLSATKKTLNFVDVLKASNPLLLLTGPIALFVKDYRYRAFKQRFSYFFPYVIVGVFFYQIIAVPLTKTFELIKFTDVISSLAFASIFELFVYMNFCGLSLIIYGLFGIIGYQVPLNFRQPFSSANIIEFWKGWHISLSLVLKTLFYAPIRKKLPTSIALLGVYIASAMWHGVTFNFLLWGIFHALMFILTIKLLKHGRKYLPTIVLVVAVVIGRLLFAENQTNRLLEKLMFSYDGFGHLMKVLLELPNHSKIALILGFGLILIEFTLRNTKMVSRRNYKFLRTPIALLIQVTLFILLANDLGGGYAVYGQR